MTPEEFRKYSGETVTVESPNGSYQVEITEIK